jgi:hypothetical protein
MEHDFLTAQGAFLVTSLIYLFIIIDPPGNIFPSLAPSAGYTPAATRGLARQACLYALLILSLFVVLGRLLLLLFGITRPALHIAGGFILFRFAIDLLEGRGHLNRIDTSSSLNAADYRDLPPDGRFYGGAVSLRISLTGCTSNRPTRNPTPKSRAACHLFIFY